MDAMNNLSKTASLIADPSRAAMLWSLMDGQTRPASELAMLANISPQTASNHLKLLLDAGFLKVASNGRNRFYRLSGGPVAVALESLAAASGKKPPVGTAEHVAPELVFARTCYDHLAGELGVAILNRLREKNHLAERSEEYELTSAGEKFLATIGVDVETAQAKRRRFAYACLDWSHRVPHLGGSLGAAILNWLFENRIAVHRKASRAVRLTDSGQNQLGRLFGIKLSRTGTALASTR
jgi:DNA-binding transcriptional ArsR family regulator